MSDINIIQESTLSMIEEDINEALHMFNGQAEASKKITEVVYDAITRNDDACSVDIEEESAGQLKIVRVKLDYVKDAIYSKVSAQIDQLYENGDIEITICYGFFNKASQRPEQFKNEIGSAISHELMHGNIFFKRYNNNEELNDAPKYYDGLQTILSSPLVNPLIYKLAYALYSTYYQETQALISQTSVDVDNLMRGKQGRDEFIKAIKQTNGYRAFYSNLYETVPELEEKMCPVFEKTITKELKKYGVVIDDLSREIKRIKVISEKALKTLINSTMRISGKYL